MISVSVSCLQSNLVFHYDCIKHHRQQPICICLLDALKRILWLQRTDEFFISLSFIRTRTRYFPPKHLCKRQTETRTYFYNNTTDLSFVFPVFYPAPVFRPQPSTRSLTARTSLGQQRKTSSSFRCGYSFRFPGERVTYNRQVASSSEGSIYQVLLIFPHNLEYSINFLGPVVQKRINTNPRLKN